MDACGACAAYCLFSLGGTCTITCGVEQHPRDGDFCGLVGEKLIFQYGYKPFVVQGRAF